MDGCGDLVKPANEFGSSSKIKINLKKKPERLHQSSIYEAISEKDCASYNSCSEQYKDAISRINYTSKVVGLVMLSHNTMTCTMLGETIHKDMCTAAHPGLYCKNDPVVTKNADKFLVKFPHELMAISFFNKYGGKYLNDEKNMTFEKETDEEEISDISVYSVDLNGQLESIFISSISMDMFKVKKKTGDIVKSPFHFNFYSIHGSLTRPVTPLHLLESDQEMLDELGIKVDGGYIYLGNQEIMDEEKDSVINMLNNILFDIKNNLKQFSEKGKFDKAIIIFENWEDANLFIDMINFVKMGDDIKKVVYSIGVLPSEQTEPVLECSQKLFGYEPRIDPRNIHERNVMMNALLEKFIRISFSSLESLLIDHTVAVGSLKNLICEDSKENITKEESCEKNDTKDSPLLASIKDQSVSHCFTAISMKNQKIPQSLNFRRWTKITEATSPNLKDPNLFLLSLKTTRLKNVKWVSSISIHNMVTNINIINIAVIPNYIFNKTPKTANEYCRFCSKFSVLHADTDCPSQDQCLRCPNQPQHTLNSCLVHALSCWNCGDYHSWRDCPSMLLTRQQGDLYRAGYRFSFRGGKMVCTFLTENGEVPCHGERETIRTLSSLLEGSINIFLGYNIYEVVMELLKFVTTNFHDNNFFVSLVHGMIDMKSLFTGVKNDASLKDLISSTNGKLARALDTPQQVCEQINMILRKKYNFEEENISFLCNNFAVISSTFLTNYMATDNQFCPTPSQINILEEESLEGKPNTNEQPQVSLEEQCPEISIFEIYSFVYLYVSWKGKDVREVKFKAISKFREKHFTAKSHNINQTLYDFSGYMEANISFFPNPILVSLCPDGAKVLDQSMKVRNITRDLLELFVGHFDLWSASAVDFQASLKSLKTEDKSKLEVLYRQTCDKSVGEYQSVLWTMQEIHASIFKNNNFEDLPFTDLIESLNEPFSLNETETNDTMMTIDEEPTVFGQQIETHVTGNKTSGTQATAVKHVGAEEEVKTKRGKSVYGGHSFIYLDLKLERAEDQRKIVNIKIKAESKYREKYFRADGKNVKKALENLINYLHKNDKYPKPICITTTEEDLDYLSLNLKAMSLFERFVKVFSGWNDLSSKVEQLDSRLKYKAFSKSGRTRLEKDYASVFGRLIDHQSTIWTMKELHLETLKKFDYKNKLKSFTLPCSDRDSSSSLFDKTLIKKDELNIEVEESIAVSVKRKSEEFNLGESKRIKEEPLDDMATLEESSSVTSSTDYHIKMEDLKQEYERKQELCAIIAENEEENSNKEEFTVEALVTVEIGSGQTKSLVGRILCFSDQISDKKLKLLTHPTLIYNFAPSLQFVRSRATPSSEEDIVKVFHVVLHMTNLSKHDIVVEKETILGTASTVCAEDMLMKGRRRVDSIDALNRKDDEDIADTGVNDIAVENLEVKLELVAEG